MNPFPADLKDELSQVFTKNYRLFVVLAKQNLYRRIKRDAEDVVQQAFLYAAQTLHLFRGDSSMKTWVSIMVVREAWRTNRDNEPSRSDYVPVTESHYAPGWEHCPSGRHQHCIPATHQAFLKELENGEILNRLYQRMKPEEQDFLERWISGEFKGQMENNINRNRLARAKLRMKGIAEEIGILRDAA